MAGRFGVTRASLAGNSWGELVFEASWANSTLGSKRVAATREVLFMGWLSVRMEQAMSSITTVGVIICYTELKYPGKGKKETAIVSSSEFD